MQFILLIFATAFMMEAIGTYISVFGLGALFAGDPVILTMAVILDVAKIVSVSFLYQYWEKVNRAMKYYLLVSVLVLMTITSSGAFGYLSQAFQKAIQPTQEVALKVDAFTHERDALVAEKAQLTTERQDMDKQIAQLPTDYVKGRRQLMSSFKPEQDRIRSRLSTITKRIDDLNTQVLAVQNENIDKQVHAGPIIYVAKAFNISVEEASKWIIIIIILTFDPLAIILILAGNFLVKLRKDAKVEPKVDVESQNVVEEFNESLERWDASFKSSKNDEVQDAMYKTLKVAGEFDKQEIVTPVTQPLVQPEFPFEVVSVDELSALEEPIDDVIEVVAPDDPIMIQFVEALLPLVYDDVDTGEEPEAEDDVDFEPLVTKINSYIPSVPVIDVTGDTSYSGSPQAELIDAPMVSSLEALKINMPEALLRPEVTPSTKKAFYE